MLSITKKSQEPEEFQVELVEIIKPGDLVVLRVDAVLSMEQASMIKNGLSDLEKNGIKFLVLDKSTSLEKILRPEDGTPRSAA